MADRALEERQAVVSGGARGGAGAVRETTPVSGASWADRGRAHRAVILLGFRLSNPAEIIRRVEEGFSFHALERFQKNTQIPTDDLAEVVAIKRRTLHRRKKEGRLEPDESDRLLRVSTVFAKALELFEGDAEAAKRWFYTPARALGGKRPIAFARTDLGTREIEALIDRLEHGVLT
jgi:putative toxin-antitoxin system antitoxin component (TIGR02293 family)